MLPRWTACLSACASVTLNRRNVSKRAIWLHRGRSIFCAADGTRRREFSFTGCCDIWDIWKREMAGGMWKPAGTYLTALPLEHRDTFFLRGFLIYRLCRSMIRRELCRCVLTSCFFKCLSSASHASVNTWPVCDLWLHSGLHHDSRRR